MKRLAPLGVALAAATAIAWVNRPRIGDWSWVREDESTRWAPAAARQAPPVSAAALLEWNGVVPDFRIVEEEHGATPTYMIVADYGWAERILCGGCYEQDADAILAALNEATRRPVVLDS